MFSSQRLFRVNGQTVAHTECQNIPHGNVNIHFLEAIS